MVAVPMLEDEATAELRPLFADVRATMRAPFTPALFRTLARWPAYLQLVWPQLRPGVATAGFRGSALYLSAMAHEATQQFYEPEYGRATLRDDGMTDTGIDELAGALEVLHLTNPQTLLIAAALSEAFERPRVGGQGRPEPRDTTDEEARVLAYVWRMPEEAALPDDVRAMAADIREILRLPFLTDDFRAFARWPVFLKRAWPELRELRVYKLFRQRGRGLYYYSRSSSRFLAEPIEAGPDAMRAAGLDDAECEAVAEVLRMFCGILPNHIMNTAAIQQALGIRPEPPPPPAPRPV